MKANKDKAWQEPFLVFLQCEAGPFSGPTGPILVLSLPTLNLKNIQGIYSYTHSVTFKSVNARSQNIKALDQQNSRVGISSSLF